MKKKTVPIEKGRRIMNRRVMAEARKNFRGLLDELGIERIKFPRSTMVLIEYATCEEAKQILDTDYPKINTRRRAAAFERLQDYFHQKYGDAIPVRPVPQNLPSRPTFETRLIRIPKKKMNEPAR